MHVIEALAVQMRVAFMRAILRRPALGDLQRMVQLARADFAALGPPAGGAGVPVGYSFTPAEARAVQARLLRHTLRNAVQNVPYYRELLRPDAHRGVSLASFAGFPVTTKDDIRRHGDRFLNRRCTDVALYIETSGTTGSRLGMYLSTYELEAWAAGVALAGATAGNLTPADVQQVNLAAESRGDWYVAERAAGLAGTTAIMQGTVPPRDALVSLAAERSLPWRRSKVSTVTAETTYLVELVRVGREQGMTAADFALRRVTGGGDVAASHYVRAIEGFFGAPYADAYGASEIVPVMALRCRNGFYHFDETVGLIELIDAVTRKPLTMNGARGCLVVTPFFPWRHCFPLIRYWTGDMAERADCRCGATQNGGVFRILGRERYNIFQSGRLFTQWDCLETLGGVPGASLPLRYWVEPTDAAGATPLGDRPLKVHIQAVPSSDLVAVAAASRAALESAGLSVAEVVAHMHPHFHHFPLRWERRLPAHELGPADTVPAALTEGR